MEPQLTKLALVAIFALSAASPTASAWLPEPALDAPILVPAMIDGSALVLPTLDLGEEVSPEELPPGVSIQATTLDGEPVEANGHVKTYVRKLDAPPAESAGPIFLVRSTSPDGIGQSYVFTADDVQGSGSRTLYSADGQHAIAVVTWAIAEPAPEAAPEAA